MSDMARQREKYKWGRDRNSVACGVWGVSLQDSWRQDLTHFQSEVVEVRASGWLLCFSELQVEPQYLSLGFNYSCFRLVQNSWVPDGIGYSQSLGTQYCGSRQSLMGSESACVLPAASLLYLLGRQKQHCA